MPSRFDNIAPSNCRLRIAAAAATTFLVGIFNFVCLILVVALSSSEWQDAGSKILFTGSCARIETYSTVSHLVINILSSCLLGASNYTQQCLAAPSRQEVDDAHQRRQWLEIGVPSLRNLWRISRRRVILISCVALASLPLHLL